MYYRVTYKHFNRPRAEVIVKAETELEAIKNFSNPNEVGLTAEIIETKQASRIPKGWNVSFSKNDFPVTGRTNDTIPLELDFREVRLFARNRRFDVKVGDIICAFPPSRDKQVMNRGFWI